MDLSGALVRYRMSIALALGFLGPTVAAILMGAAGMTSPTQLDTMTKLVVWGVGVWAFGAAGYELWAGVQRYREDTEPTDQPAEGEPA